MDDLNVWAKEELSDEEVRKFGAVVGEYYPEVGKRIQRAVEVDGELASLIRSFPQFVSLFELWESIGIHVTPVHWSSPVANVQELSDDLWDGPSEVPGIDFRMDEQLDRLSKFESAYRSEYERFPIGEPSEEFNGFTIDNGFFESVDTEMAYSMIREHEPKRVIEIGSGNSTQVLNAALRENDQEEYEHLIIEPEPTPLIRGADAKLMESKVQDVPMSVFNSLTEDDVLFIDSTHVGRIGSDVLYECLNVIPQLDEGVLLHVHDIFLPYEYPRSWVKKYHWFFNEQYFTQALLTGRDDEVLWSTYRNHKEHPELLESAFDSYDELGEGYEADDARGIPSSLWVRVGE